jgi:hypothetical protein
MAKTDIYADREIRSVELTNPNVPSIGFTYFFKTSVDSSEVTVLGQKGWKIGDPVTGLTYPAILGTRKPSPIRVKNNAKGITTFCSSAKLKDAKAAGWSRVKKAQFNTKRSNTFPSGATARGSLVVYVNIPSGGADMFWGWRMPFSQAVKIGVTDLGKLGIKLATSDANWGSLVLGCNSIRPPRTSQTIFSGATGKQDTITTFYDPSVTLESPWVPAGSGSIFEI